MRIRSSLLVIALVSCGLAWLGCSSEDPSAEPQETPDQIDRKPDGSGGTSGTGGSSGTSGTGDKDASDEPVTLEDYRIVGRFDTRDADGPRISWSGTQIIAKFTGTTVSVDLGDTSDEDQFDVSIDGAPPTLLDVDQAERTTYELARGLSAGEHTLVLTKRTEALIGEAQLFAINATLVGTPPASSRRIEMVGDSITAGYGVLGDDENCNFSADTEDESRAWGSLAAKELGVVHSAIAWSGIGLVHDYDGSTEDQMPERYGRALATDAESTWDHARFEPAVVVVALGTNDFGGKGGDPGDEFVTKLIAFLRVIRGAHADANIVLATSPMLEGATKAKQKSYFEASIAARRSAGDTKLTLLDIASITEAEGFGCDYHPSRSTQERMGKALAAHVKTLTGW